MRAVAWIVGLIGGAVCVTAAPVSASAQAQIQAHARALDPAYALPQSWDVASEALSPPLARLDAAGAQGPDAPEGSLFVVDRAFFAGPGRADALAATTRSDVWLAGDGFQDRLRLRTDGVLRRADGAPLPLTPVDEATLEAEAFNLSYIRGWPAARAYTASGLEIVLTPHAGLGVGSGGGSAEAGATLRIGQGLSNMVRDGQEAFGDRGRWYIFAAGSGRAVGYNFARTRDGDYARSGMSQDSGAFLGDASVGVAWRRGDMQSSFGLVYREIEAEGLQGGRDFDRDVDEGLVAFQLSIKPDW